MKGIIIYKGKYGATRQYAEWLGEELGLAVMTTVETDGLSLVHYDYILIGTSVYIGKLQVKKWLDQNISDLQGKKIFLFQVAGTPVQEKDKRQAYNKTNIPAAIIHDCDCYFLPGRLVINKLNWKDRFLLKMGARLTKDPAAKKTMLADYDDVKKEHLDELIAAVKKYADDRSDKNVTEGAGTCCYVR